MPNIILLGSPYSGKSTQCRNISSFLNLLHLPTGEILRTEILNKTPIGIETENTVTKGLFAPDIILENIVIHYLDNVLKNSSNVLFDGYPRNSSQMETLINILSQRQSVIDMIIVLDIPQEEWLLRAENRAKLENREDDKDREIVKLRFELYKSETLPLLKVAKKNNIPVMRINAIGTNENVFEKIKPIIKLI